MRLLSKTAVVSALAVLLAAFSFTGTALAQWQPKKPVEFIIMAGTGGGADQMARLMQSIIQKNDFSNQPFIPINKPGGSGAEALRYLQDKSGDDHVVMITLNSFYTTPLQNPGLGVDISTFHTDRPHGAGYLPAVGQLRLCDIKSLDDYVMATVKEARQGLEDGRHRPGPGRLAADRHAAEQVRLSR